jgi:hypothetical protein
MSRDSSRDMNVPTDEVVVHGWVVGNMEILSMGGVPVDDGVYLEIGGAPVNDDGVEVVSIGGVAVNEGVQLVSIGRNRRRRSIRESLINVMQQLYHVMFFLWRDVPSLRALAQTCKGVHEAMLQWKSAAESEHSDLMRHRFRRLSLEFGINSNLFVKTFIDMSNRMVIAGSAAARSFRGDESYGPESDIDCYVRVRFGRNNKPFNKGRTALDDMLLQSGYVVTSDTTGGVTVGVNPEAPLPFYESMGVRTYQNAAHKSVQIMFVPLDNFPFGCPKDIIRVFDLTASCVALWVTNWDNRFRVSTLYHEHVEKKKVSLTHAFLMDTIRGPDVLYQSMVRTHKYTQRGFEFAIPPAFDVLPSMRTF